MIRVFDHRSASLFGCFLLPPFLFSAVPSALACPHPPTDRFFLCNFILHLYLAVDKLFHLVSLQPIVDIVTVFPSYLILFVNVRETAPPLPPQQKHLYT